MNVVYFRSPTGETNFGDELNLVIWDKMFKPSMADYKPGALFFGIGTLLNEGVMKELPPAEHYYVCGAGAGYGPPIKMDEKWTVYAVRGPLTADQLGIPDGSIRGYLAYGDPGILVADFWKQVKIDHPTSFMPRWDTISQRPHIVEACEKIGIHVIDPRKPVDVVMGELEVTGHLISEAFHGAVCADALRIPWTPVVYAPGHEFKWQDWCATMELEYKPEYLTRTPLEQVARTGRRFLSSDTVHEGALGDMWGAADDMYYDVSR